MILKTPAKLNLSLAIEGRDGQGYHLLRTVMQAIDLYDTLTFLPGRGLTLTGSGEGIAMDESNLVYRAAALFYREAGLSPAVRIDLQKAIPTRAGLGGGSGNAAGTLFALNERHGKPFSPERLAALALALGADVPFFLQGGRALAQGRGERLTPQPVEREAYLLLMNAPGVDTGAAYRAYDEAPGGGFDNDLTGPVCRLCPAVEQDLLRLRTAAGNAHLTGSGACCFARLPDVAQAQEAARRLGGGRFLAVARPIEGAFLWED